MRLINISKKYGDNIVLKNINLDFENKGIIFICGRSGSGKSTLLNVMGLLDRQYEGEISIDNKIVKKNGINTYLSKYIDFVFQDINLINTINLKDNILFAESLVYENDSKYIEKINKKLDIEDCIERKPKNLSGGEKQRGAISRALSRKHSILLADEPTGNLDSENEKAVFDILKDISKDKLVIVVTHNKEAAYEYGDRVITIEDGKIANDEDFGYDNNLKLFNDVDLEENMIKKESKQNKGFYKWACKLAISNMLSRKSKIISGSILMLFCMICIIFSIGLNSTINYVCNVIDGDILENDCYSIFDFGNREYGYNFYELDNEFINDIKKDKEIVRYNDYYLNLLNVIKDEDNFSSSIKYKVVDFKDDFFRKRYNLIEGNYPEKEEEVVINRKFADEYFDGENAIGKYMEISWGFNGKVKVVGIKKDDVLKKDQMLVCDKFCKFIIKKSLEQRNDEIRIIDNNINTSLCVLAKDEEELAFENVRDKKGYKILYGNEPSDESDVMVNVSSVNVLLHNLGITAYYSNKDLYKKEMPQEYFEEIKKIVMKYDLNGEYELGNVNICGIYSINENDESFGDIESEGISILLKKNFFNKIKDGKAKNYLNVYIKNSKGLEHVNEIAKKYGYTVEKSNPTTDELGDKVKVVLVFFVIATCIIIIISICVLGFISKINAIDSTYEVGILKSLGVKDSKIFIRFLLESLIQGLAVGIAASLIGIIIQMGGFIKYEGVNVFHIKNYEWVLIVLLTVLISVFSAFVQYIKLSRSDVVTCIKRNQ